MTSIRQKVVGLMVVLGILYGGAVGVQGQVKIQLSVWGMPWEDQIYTKYAIPQFEEENPGIKVEFMRLENYWELLLTRHAAGQAPDVQRNLDLFYGRMRLRGAIQPLTKYIEGPDGLSLDDFYEVAMKALYKEGQMWGLPQDICPRSGLFYNMKVFDEAGISYPTADWTLDKLIEVAEKLTKGKRPRVERYGVLGWFEDFPSWFILNYGGSIWSEDGKRCILNSDAAVEGIRHLQDVIYEDKAVPTMAEYTVEAAGDLFRAEKVAMFLGGAWLTPAFTRDVPDLKFGIALPPVGPQGKRICFVHQCLWEMSTQTKHPDASWKLIKHLVSPPVLKEYWQRTWVAAPSLGSMVKDPDIFETIIGIPGHVPAITDPEEFQRKIAWIRDVVLKKAYYSWASDFSFELYFQILPDEIDNLFGVRRGDPKEILDRVAEKQNKLMEEFYKK